MLKDSTYHKVVSPYFDFRLYLSLPFTPWVKCLAAETQTIFISVLMLKTLRSRISYTARFQTVNS